MLRFLNKFTEAACALEGRLNECRNENIKATNALVEEIDKLTKEPIAPVVLQLRRRRESS